MPSVSFTRALQVTGISLCLEPLPPWSVSFRFVPFRLPAVGSPSSCRRLRRCTTEAPPLRPTAEPTALMRSKKRRKITATGGLCSLLCPKETAVEVTFGCLSSKIARSVFFYACRKAAWAGFQNVLIFVSLLCLRDPISVLAFFFFVFSVLCPGVARSA